ncbi:MAG: sugar transferase [Actinomycetota bacterium]|nr:sugar transferase [Actinomycetota bacterium]
MNPVRAQASLDNLDTLKLVTSEADLKLVDVDSPERDTEIRLDPQLDIPGVERSGGVGRLYSRIAGGLAATDVLCLISALLVAWTVRFGFIPLTTGYVLALGLGAALWIPVFHAYGLYGVRHLSAAEEFRRVISAASTGALLVVLVSYWSKSELSREWVALTWAFAVVLELTTRRLWRSRVYHLRSEGRLSVRTLIVGTNEEAGRLAAALRTPRLGFEPIGFVATTEGHGSPAGHPVLGRLAGLSELVEEYGAECVFVASTAVTSQDALKIMQVSRRTGMEVRVSANLPQILASRLSVQPVGPEVMAISLKPVRLSGTQTLVKRVFDFAVSSIGLLVSLPVLSVIALAIRLTSKGPVLFRQERITKGGRAFTVYKFRTMLVDGDRVLRERGISTDSPFFKIEDDPRLTGVGRILRKLSLDELPQLLNVIKGDMSLVGPRPLPTDQVAANLELLGPRHEVPTGVTGWWQVNGRSSVAPEEALRLDLFYIENWSLSLDLYIMLKTFGVLMARRGAY